MLDTHVAWLANQGMNYLATGENPARLGNQHPNIVPYQVFPTADGHIVLSIGNDPTFKRFCEAFALTHLLEDARFATNAARVENRQLVTDTLTPVMQQHPTDWWVERLEALKIGCGPINKLSEVFADPHVVARGVVLEMAHGSGETVKVIANPVRLSETPPDYRIPPPLLGEHTDAVLRRPAGARCRGAGGAAGEGRDLSTALVPRRAVALLVAQELAGGHLDPAVRRGCQAQQDKHDAQAANHASHRARVDRQVQP